MNRDIAQGEWLQLKGKVKARWGKLTDDELEQAEGHTEKLIGLLQTHYGMAREEAEKALDKL
ncbi:MAG: CsbD family protein [Pseudomonadota bacterium]|uniref:CsbD family protein n=1 Tax=Gallaecimonas pentaromativorans TaxID=584787 RepID=UPI00067EB5C4|nr:CsbD family protein [Gallaecimonas pentaromativorans]MED5526259.1 CsbD family protein [Pseudomonadota bacterium]